MRVNPRIIAAAAALTVVAGATGFVILGHSRQTPVAAAQPSPSGRAEPLAPTFSLPVPTPAAATTLVSGRVSLDRVPLGNAACHAEPARTAFAAPAASAAASPLSATATPAASPATPTPAPTPARTVVTDAVGAYSFTLGEGSYSIGCSAPGGATAPTANPVVVRIGGGTTHPNLDFNFVSAKAPSSTAPPSLSVPTGVQNPFAPVSSPPSNGYGTGPPPPLPPLPPLPLPKP